MINDYEICINLISYRALYQKSKYILKVDNIDKETKLTSEYILYCLEYMVPKDILENNMTNIQIYHIPIIKVNTLYKIVDDINREEKDENIKNANNKVKEFLDNLKLSWKSFN